jgi:hypothetical protein
MRRWAGRATNQWKDGGMTRERRYVLVGVLVASALAAPIVLVAHAPIGEKIVAVAVGTAAVVLRGISWTTKSE